MPPMNLNWSIQGRPVKPVAFSLMVTMIILAVINIQDIGLLGDAAEGDVLAGLAIGVAVILGLAWWRRSQSMAELGLAGACFVWGIRFFLTFFVNGLNALTTEGFYLSLCWVMVAGGSYLLEKIDKTTTRGF